MSGAWRDYYTFVNRHRPAGAATSRNGAVYARRVLFTKDAWPGLADGSITVTFRRWKRPQARVGGHYRAAGLLLEVTEVRQQPVSEVTALDAARAGAPDLVTLLQRLRAMPDELVTRVEFRCIGTDDRIERRAVDDLDADAIAEIRRRLDRLDRSAGAPWTAATLRLIARSPGVVSTALARQVDMERQVFKTKVRSLKELGLTESLEVGYRLSPRGVAVVAALGLISCWRTAPA